LSSRVVTKKPQVATCGLGCVSIERSLAQGGVAKKVFAKPSSTKSKAAKIHAAEKVAKAKPTSSGLYGARVCDPQQLRQRGVRKECKQFKRFNVLRLTEPRSAKCGKSFVS
jgi:hypothetical protein